jgi:hypothetical protein
MRKSFNAFKCFVFVFFTFLTSTSFAVTDIQCKKVEMQKYEEVICEYAILNSQYEDIFQQQKELIGAGLIQENLVDSWRNKRNLCIDVACMDSVFGEWKTIADRIARPNTAEQAVLPPTQTEQVKLPDSPAPIAEANPTSSSPKKTAVAPDQVSASEPDIQPASAAESGRGFGGLIFMIMVIIGVFKFFRGGGSNNSSNKNSKKELASKPSPEKYPKGWTNCATCEYWIGNRDVEHGTKVIVDKANQQGKCVFVKNLSPRPTKANSRCTHWKKWGTLSD